jgi:hypothetical protein
MQQFYGLGYDQPVSGSPRAHLGALAAEIPSKLERRIVHHLGRNLPASSGTRFAFPFNGVNDHAGDVVLAKFRTDQHVIQVRIVPIATEIHPDEVGTLLIGQSNQMLDICGSRQAPPNTGGSFAPWSVDEDVKNVLLVLQHALGPPAHDHTISPGVRFGDEVSAERSHGFRIEDFQASDRRDSFERPVPKASPAGAVQP